MSNPELDALRTKIDALDKQIHTLLRERFAVTAAVSAASYSNHRPPFNPRPKREPLFLRTIGCP